MIDYLKEMYNKPNYLWTAKDKLIWMSGQKKKKVQVSNWEQ